MTFDAKEEDRPPRNGGGPSDPTVNESEPILSGPSIDSELGEYLREQIQRLAMMDDQSPRTTDELLTFLTQQQVNDLLTSHSQSTPSSVAGTWYAVVTRALEAGLLVDANTGEKLVRLTDDELTDRQMRQEIEQKAVERFVNRLAERRATEMEAAMYRVPRVRRTAEEFAKVPPPDVVMAEVLAAEVNLLGGPSAAGKSLLARDWALCVAAGEAWRGHRVPRPRGVLWVASEGTHDFADRWGSRPLWDQGKKRVFVLDEPVNLLSPADVADLLREYAEDDIGLVVFDVVYGMGMTDDNGVKEVAPVINVLKQISREWGAATLALGHNGHNASRRFRGSSMWRQLAAVEHHMADDIFTCEKSKIGDIQRLRATYRLEYPAVTWTEPIEAVRDEGARRELIKEHIQCFPGLSDLERGRQLASELGVQPTSARHLIKAVRESLQQEADS